MNEISGKSDQMTLWDSLNVTSSLEPEHGLTRSDSQDGRTTNQSGPPHVPVPLFQAQVKRKPAQNAVAQTLCRMLDELATSYAVYANTNGLPMPVTYGRKCGVLSETADRHAFLENRLKARMAGLGLPLFELRWKYWAMPLGVRICALRASARAISDHAFFSWPTPCQQDGPKGGPNQGADRLPGAASLAGWTTPSATDGMRGGSVTEAMSGSSLTQLASLAGWTTPMANDAQSTHSYGKNQKPILKLPGQALLAGWSTPAARDWRDGRSSTETMNRNFRPLNEQVVGLTAWATPKASEAEHAGRKSLTHGGQTGLAEAAQLAGWATPKASDGEGGRTTQTKGGGNAHLDQQCRLADFGRTPSGFHAEIETSVAEQNTVQFRGQLNPSLSRWMMGLPVIWDICALRAWTKLKAFSRRSLKKPEPAE